MKMNRDIIEVNWKQFQGNIKDRWGYFTDDSFDIIADKRAKLGGKIQISFGITMGRTKRQLTDWKKHMKGISHLN